MSDNITSILNELVETSKDGEKGFRIAAENTKNAELQAVFLKRAEDCATGVGCTSNDDCASDVCSLDQLCAGGGTCGICVAPSCSDGKKNGLETAVDCGGGTCAGCATGKACVSNSDCDSGVCASTVTDKNNPGTCAAPTCSDTVLNGNETDVDCGGGTCTAGCGTDPATCFQCAAGAACKLNIDCAPPTGTPTTTSGVCDTASTLTCVPAELLQVAVTGAGSVSSTSPAGTLDTGDIANCTTSGGACLQSYVANATVTLTATTAATSGTISWTLTGTAATCASCTVSATAQTCPCALTMTNGIKAAVTTP